MPDTNHDDTNTPDDVSTPSDELGTDELKQILRGNATQHDGQAYIAHTFAAKNLDKFLHVYGIGWFAWTGQRWVEDTGQAQNAVLATLRRQREIAEDSADKQLRKTVAACQSAGAIESVLKIAECLRGIAAHPDDLDADPYLLNCLNGTLDLRTLELHPHDPGDRITKMCNASYDPSARSNRWDEFLGTVLPDADVRSYFQRFCGLSLIGEVIEHIFTIATGTGRNGKGAAYSVLNYVLGDYARIAEPDLFAEVKSNPNAASPAFFDLRGVRFLVLSETEERCRVAAALMKRLTGGDKIRARALYKAAVEFEPSHTSLLVTNHLPTLPADDPAVWARVRVIPFDVVIPRQDQDPHLPAKLKAEADAVLAWAIRGLQGYQADGLGEPAAIEQRTAKYAEDQDDVKRFVDEMCDDSTATGGDTTTDLHTAYEEWAFREGIPRAHKLGRRKFAKALEHLDFPATKTNRGMVHKGLAVERGDAARQEIAARLGLRPTADRPPEPGPVTIQG